MKIKKFLTRRRGILVILIIVLWNVFRFTHGYFEIIYRDLRMPFKIRPVYNEIILFDNASSDVMAYLQKGVKQMFLTEQGELREIDFELEEDLKLLDSIFLVYKDTESYSDGVITLSGKEVIPSGRFKEIFLPIDHERLIAKNDEFDYLIIDTDANIIKKLNGCPRKFCEGLSSYFEALTSDTFTDFGFIDTGGKIVIDMQFNYVRDFVNGYAAVSKYFGRDENGGIIERWGLIDKQGRLVIDFKYLDIGDYGEGLIAFSAEEIEVNRKYYRNVGRSSFEIKEKRNLYGYMDINENIVIEPQYAEASRFQFGTARVIPIQNETPETAWSRPKYEWRYIDRDNNILSELRYFVYYGDLPSHFDCFHILNYIPIHLRNDARVR
jgi:hypothetical protein